MKLIIDIPETMLDWIKNGYPNEEDMGNLIDIVLNGTPIDDVKDRIEKEADEAFESHSEWATGVYYAIGEMGLKYSDEEGEKE